MIGRILSHYRIEAPLGAGGMGVVYRARDLHLERDVALKVLPPDLLADDNARQRFRREALALSRLQHAHINVVHDFDVQEQTPFLVMELVAGGTLAEKLAQGPLTEAEALRLALQIAEAVQAAHEAGVLHRDLKPANIMVTPRGEAKVMDFGLARRFGPASEHSDTVTVTAAPGLTGTLPYLAPELLMGQEASVPSDLYALGVTLYEMLTGGRPHPETQAFALANAIMNQDAPAPRSLRPELSTALEAIVLKCLARDPATRYASVKELIADLRAPAASAALGARRRSRLAITVMGAGLALVAALALAVALDLGGLRARLFGTPRIQSIAVLPLTNLSNDPEQEYFADGMTEELITGLAQTGALSVVSRTSTTMYRNTQKPLSAVGHDLHADALVTGSVMLTGRRVQVTAQLTMSSSGTNLWTETFERDRGDAFALQSEIASAIARRVRVNLSSRARRRLSSPAEIQPDAYEAYLKGRYQMDKLSAEGYSRAAQLFDNAVRLQPDYAAAWSGLALAYHSMSSAFVSPEVVLPKARAAALRAIQLDPDLAEAHVAMATVAAFEDRDWKRSGREFGEAIRLNPSSVEAHMGLAGHLQRHGLLDRARAEYDRAVELNPLSTDAANNAIWCRYLQGDYAEALSSLQGLLRTAPDEPQTWYNLGQVQLAMGQVGQAIASFQRTRQLSGDYWPLGMLGHAYAASGRRAEALALIDSLKARADSTYVTPYLFVQLYSGLGDREECWKWVEKAFDSRDVNLLNLKVDPVLKSFRRERRFGDLVRRLGLESSG